jgi:Na+-transporting methylmalonyl-CoA/oxaloacetate decarboxylase gamma subunit
MIDWGTAWQVTGVAFGFTFGILLFLAVVVRLASILIARLPGDNQPAEKPTGNNSTAGE